jgi:quercetin dioxygenase-like cupin family protein
MDFSLSTLPIQEIMPGFRGKLIHGDQMSLVFWDVDAGSAVPEHHHKNEQIMHVISGRFEFTVDGVTREYGPGDIVLIPAHIPHSGKAHTACQLMDVFSPAREEYR